MSRITIGIFMMKCKNFTDCSLVTTPFSPTLVATPIPSVSCAPLTQKTAPLDEMISATSAVFLFYSVMLGVRVLISCDYTFNHNPCDELYGFHGLFTSCDPNFFSTIRPTATPVPKTPRINPANVM